MWRGKDFCETIFLSYLTNAAEAGYHGGFGGDAPEGAGGAAAAGTTRLRGRFRCISATSARSLPRLEEKEPRCRNLWKETITHKTSNDIFGKCSQFTNVFAIRLECDISNLDQNFYLETSQQTRRLNKFQKREQFCGRSVSAIRL